MSQHTRDGGGPGVGEEGGWSAGDGEEVLGEEHHDLLHRGHLRRLLQHCCGAREQVKTSVFSPSCSLLGLYLSLHKQCSVLDYI